MGVFAFPVVPNFWVTHQWLRERRRGRQETLVAVYFRIPDAERVTFGRFHTDGMAMSAAEATAAALAEPAEGFEIVVSRRIRPSEIRRIKTLPQLTGWRYYPEAKGRPPTYMPPGQYGAARWRASVAALERQHEAEWLRYKARYPGLWSDN